jgi:hypothetical protein
MGDIGIYVVDARPGEEELHVAGAVDVGGGVRALSAQPFDEAFDLWKHTIPPMVEWRLFYYRGGEYGNWTSATKKGGDNKIIPSLCFKHFGQG